jgi:hypothetical protein
VFLIFSSLVNGGWLNADGGAQIALPLQWFPRTVDVTITAADMHTSPAIDIRSMNIMAIIIARRTIIAYGNGEATMCTMLETNPSDSAPDFAADIMA